ncbi:MAG: WXG100 family type VII secretion target [Ruminococcus sp.]|nr:WXG100 family type VII secretion target [Ruminococcus sp.]
MTANFSVTATNLSSGAHELSRLNRSFRSMVENLSATEASLNSMWEGEARDAFRTVFQEDKVQLDNFAALIEKYAQTLAQIADNYRTAEKANTAVAATRTHH